jgi:heat shock protein beta
LAKKYEVLYLVEPVDEYCIQALPEFEGKKFQNIAKEGLNLSQSDKAKERKEATEKEFQPLLDWRKENGLKDKIEKATISERLTESPCALVASQYGWSGNMERIMKSQAYAKQGDASNQFYANNKKTLEINPRHPLIKELKARVADKPDEQTAKDLAMVMFETATMRSGYAVPDTAGFASRVERMLRMSLDIPVDEKVEALPVDDDEEEEKEEKKEEAKTEEPKKEEAEAKEEKKPEADKKDEL